MIKTGDILLVSSDTKRGRKIKKFQKRFDEKSGEWTHSGLFYVDRFGCEWVVEADVIPGYKLKAAVIFTPWDEYKQREDQKRMVLCCTQELDLKMLEDQIFKYAGRPYDYVNLILWKPIQYLFGRWLGENKHNDKRFICHEFVQTVLNNVSCMFPYAKEGNISEMYYSKFYEKC